jgi:hypothetical protein
MVEARAHPVLQTNLSDRDSIVDPKALVRAVADVGANTFLMNMGGIVAQYPTRVPFHDPSVFLPPGRDLFGDVLRESHARRIRVIGRFDLSKTQKAVFDALIHLVNGTGHHDTAFFQPLEIRDIRIDLPRDVHQVHAVALDRSLPITTNGRFRSFTVPRLQAYEVIIVQ